MLRNGWFSPCVIVSGREVWMNSTSFRILQDRLTKETHGCGACVRIGLVDLVWSLVTDRLLVFISLARLSVSLIHLHRCILAGILSGDIFISSSDSLDDHLRSFLFHFSNRWAKERVSLLYPSLEGSSLNQSLVQSTKREIDLRREKRIEKHSRK